MKHAFLLITLSLAVLILFAATANAEDLLRVGDKAPAFSGTAYDGKSFSLGDAAKDSPVLLVFIRGFS